MLPGQIGKRGAGLREAKLSRSGAMIASSGEPGASSPTSIRSEVMPVEGLITIPSSHGPAATMAKLEAAVKAKGLTVFSHVDHAAGAAAVGLTLLPTDLLVFGNAKGGTPLMQAVQTIGIDLPLKVLVWQDASGKTWLSYNDPAWIAKRHGTGAEAEVTVKALSGALAAFTAAAAS
jgi:uncharacterized protein (DUF302 family)